MTDLSLSNQAIAGKTAPPAEARRLRLPTQWLGVTPFFVFAIMFLILPTLYLMLGAFQN
ncbi:acriflavin resistance protein, partial [Mesorhizobium sp. USDA-HM6]